MMKATAVLLMGGKGERFGSELPKQFHCIAGKKIYLHTLERFLKSALFQEIILVTVESWMSEVSEELPQGPIKLVKGGTTRQASSYLGLQACNPDTEIVLIHDVARPFVSQKILKENLLAAQLYGAVNTCIPSTDTLVQRSADNFILSVPDRSTYMRGQTPQTFSYPLILKAHQESPTTHATDDCQLMVAQGYRVKIVEGEETNLKITTLHDLKIAETLLHPLYL